MRLATFQSNAAALSAPDAIDPVEARWAADAVASLARQLDPDSIVGVILKRSQRELASLATNRMGAGEVTGPVRVRVAA